MLYRGNIMGSNITELAASYNVNSYCTRVIRRESYYACNTRVDGIESKITTWSASGNRRSEKSFHDLASPFISKCAILSPSSPQSSSPAHPLISTTPSSVALASPIHMSSENADSRPVSPVDILSEDEDRSTGSFVTALPEDEDNASGETDGDCEGNKITRRRKRPRDDEEEFLKQILDLQTECDESTDTIKALRADVRSRVRCASAKD
jgi:hypothetical protein